MNDRIQKGVCSEDAWNQTSIELAAAADAHCRAFIVETYAKMMEKIEATVSNELKTVLIQLRDLYGVHTALKLTGDLLRV